MLTFSLFKIVWTGIVHDLPTYLSKHGRIGSFHKHAEMETHSEKHVATAVATAVANGLSMADKHNTLRCSYSISLCLSQ